MRNEFISMKEEPKFTNREITEMFNDVKQSLARIEEQTTRHNGRMTKVEEWKAFMSGGIAVLVAIVLPILTWSVYTLVNIQDTVNEAVAQHYKPII